MTQTTVVFKATQPEQQIVYGVVYEPGVLDTHGDMMTAEDIEIMAHRFMMDVLLSKSIDHMHDNEAVEAYPIESFIAREGDPDYPVGAWVLGVKIVDEDIWAKVKKGEINGYSFEARVTKKPVVVEIEYEPTCFLKTEMADGHDHDAWLRFDENGIVVAGRTSRHPVDGHYHDILSGTATEEAFNHSHRLVLH
jgi:hypothetical protein